MEALSCRLLPYKVADGSWNMAADEVLLEAAMDGIASFRLYGWTPATLSLGYFQPARLRLSHPRFASLPFVRRPTGGQALVHDRELTYALALPAGSVWQPDKSPTMWLRRMHRVIAAALADHGIAVTALPAEAERPFDGLLCFLHPTAGDLMMGTHKVVGSAQRRVRGALLQHGGILLGTSPYTPELPGLGAMQTAAHTVSSLCAAVERWLRHETGCKIVPVRWNAADLNRIEDLVRTKYSQAWWNEKR